MEKYIECQNCQKQYDCERTYLGGCTDGKEWKLTDEEIVSALICCSIKPTACAICPLSGASASDCSELIDGALDLIHRLQSENEQLTEENERLSDLEFTQEHCDLYKENEYLKSCLVLATKQAVKDTAKEILQYVGDLYDDGDQRFRLKDYQWHKTLCKKYCVEME